MIRQARKKAGDAHSRKVLLIFCCISTLCGLAFPFSRQLFSFPTVISPGIGNKQEKPFAIVISACDGSLEWLGKSIISCGSYDIFIYERCNPEGKNDSIAMLTIPANLLACTSIKQLDNVSHLKGKSHQAYLHHIIHSWNHLHNITAFLKDTSVHSTSDLVNLHGNIQFKSLGADGPPVGRRGKATVGLSSDKIAYAQKMFHLFVRTSNKGDVAFAKRYVIFRSVFAVSSTMIRKNSKQLYMQMMDFVMQGTNMSNCDYSCAFACPNCEVIERIWPDILHCGDKFTPFHAILNREDVMWNYVLPKSCSSIATPLLELSACDSGGTLCFDTHIEEIVKSIYVAAVLRWDILLSVKSEKCVGPGKHLNFSRYQFVERMDSSFGIRVQYDARGYEHISRDVFSCGSHYGCHSQGRTIEQVIDILKFVNGKYVILPSFFRNQTFVEEVSLKGANFTKAVLMQM